MELMVRVMASGVFDILHGGHLHYFEEARALGDELVVVVARDSTAVRTKWRPIIGEDLRLEMVKALRMVDDAVMGHESDMFQTVRDVAPDIIALGYDQTFNERELEEKLAAQDLNVKVARLEERAYDLGATRRIIERIIQAYQFHMQMKDIEDPDDVPAEKNDDEVWGLPTTDMHDPLADDDDEEDEE